MSTRESLIHRLAPDYEVVAVDDDRYHIVRDHDEVLDRPILLVLEETSFEEYLDRLLRSGEEHDLAGALGLVRVHLEAAIESGIAVGRRVAVLGVRREGWSSRPRWFVERVAAPQQGAGESEQPLEWRA